MATFNGTIAALSPIQSGTSKSGKAWRKIDVVLEYEHHDQWPKAIVFSVMNDNIEKFGFQVGGEYEVEVDFSAREYNSRYYMSANAWKATAKNVAAAAAPQQAPAQPGWEAAYPAPQQRPQAQQESDNLPF